MDHAHVAAPVEHEESGDLVGLHFVERFDRELVRVNRFRLAVADLGRAQFQRVVAVLLEQSAEVLAEGLPGVDVIEPEVLTPITL